jgi:hypothetical protein
MRKLLLGIVSILVLLAGCIYIPAGGQPTGTSPAATQPPVISAFSADPGSIQPGGSSTLSWSVTGASSVTIDNGIGNVAVSGKRTVAPSVNTIYTLTATSTAGSMNATTQVIVSGSPTPPATGTAGLPVINSFGASPNSISAGGTSTLSWNVSNAGSINITPGIGNVAATGSTSVSPSSSTAYAITASNSYGNASAGTQVIVSGGGPSTPVVPPLLHLPPLLLLPITVYDFVAQAPTASWMSVGNNLTFPGLDTDNRGFALWRNNVTLEDNAVYAQVLETHPQWVTSGIVQGAYVAMASSYTVQANDHFYSQVGFIKGASAGDVRFKVMIRTDAGNVWIADVTKTYSGALRTIDIPLSAYAGKKADFILDVDANNPNATQDWAVWVNTKITR